MLDFIYSLSNKITAVVYECSLADVTNGLRKEEQSYFSLKLTYHVLFGFCFQKCLLFGQVPRDGPAHLALVYATVLLAFWPWSHDWSFFCFMANPAHFVVLQLHCYEVIMRWLNIFRLGYVLYGISPICNTLHYPPCDGVMSSNVNIL